MEKARPGLGADGCSRSPLIAGASWLSQIPKEAVLAELRMQFPDLGRDSSSLEVQVLQEAVRSHLSKFSLELILQPF